MLEGAKDTELSNDSSSPKLNRLSRDERGVGGVSSLILLIATILVSAIVAGVLVETIGELQAQSERTGDQAISEVSTGLNAISVIGDRGENSQNRILEVEILVRLQSGSRSIDLGDVVIQVDDGNITDELVHEDASFTSEEIRGPFENNIIEQGSLIRIIIDVDEVGLDLGTSTPFEIRLIPQEGQTTRLSLRTPSVFVTRKVELK